MPFPGQTMKPLVKLPADPSACWEWLGNTDDAGYARKVLNGQDMTAARWVWLTLFGPLPDGLVVSMTCGSRTCCNPYHLRACTQAEANRSGIAATLTPADVLEIRRARKSKTPKTAEELAERMGITPGTVRAIWAGTTWSSKKRSGEYQRKRMEAA